MQILILSHISIESTALAGATVLDICFPRTSSLLQIYRLAFPYNLRPIRDNAVFEVKNLKSDLKPLE